MKEAIIVDIDGTLADCTHRRSFLEGAVKDWDRFYESMGDDEANENVLDLVQSAFFVCPKLYVTGRPEKYRDLTRKWLQSHGLFSRADSLFMRPNNNFISDEQIKKKIYMEKIAPSYKIKLVLDDRNRVVQMWRSLGLECWQVAEGDF